MKRSAIQQSNRLFFLYFLADQYVRPSAKRLSQKSRWSGEALPHELLLTGPALLLFLSFPVPTDETPETLRAFEGGRSEGGTGGQGGAEEQVGPPPEVGTCSSGGSRRSRWGPRLRGPALMLHTRSAPLQAEASEPIPTNRRRKANRFRRFVRGTTRVICSPC